MAKAINPKKNAGAKPDQTSVPKRKRAGIPEAIQKRLSSMSVVSKAAQKMFGILHPLTLSERAESLKLVNEALVDPVA